MEASLQGAHSFRYLDIKLAPGETLVTESGAMATMSPAIDMKAKFNGGLLVGLLRRFLGGESLFINEFSNPTNAPQRITLTAPSPGDIREMKLNDETIYLQPGAYICSTPGVKVSVRWAGFTSLIAREGLFRIAVSGRGSVWFGAYGEIMERMIDGEYIVDSGHLVGYDPTVNLKLQLSSGIFGSFFSGEGFVTRVNGTGRVYMQSRSLSGLASWLNPKL